MRARPGQTYALQARMAIATLREREPSVEIEIRWCPRTKGPRKRGRGRWAKQAASEPDDHGVEWLAYANGVRRPLPPTSLVRLKRRASEKKWPEAWPWCERRQVNRGYVLRKKVNPIRP